MIEFNKVSVNRDNNRGIHDISFNIKAGRFVYLMGPTGAGKSTIIKAIQRSIKIDSGKIIVNDQDISCLSKKTLAHYRRNIGMIFQDFKLLNDRTVFENVALPLIIEGFGKNDIADNVNDVLSRVGLSTKSNSYPLNLSGGEQQRVSIARAIVKHPKLILADEPTGNLDPNIAHEIVDLLEDAAKLGSSVIMSTHNYELIKNRKKRFIELEEGKQVNWYVNKIYIYY